MHHERSCGFLRGRRRRFGTRAFPIRMLFGALRLAVRADYTRVLTQLGLIAHQQVIVESEEAKLRVRRFVKRSRADASTILIRRELLSVLRPGAYLPMMENVIKLTRNKAEFFNEPSDAKCGKFPGRSFLSL